MSKYIYLYRGPAPSAHSTPEQAAERATAFGAWMDRVSGALIDVGSPFGASTALRDDGTETPAENLIGYTIVEAKDLSEAAELTDGLPFLAKHDGTCSVEIFELLPM